MLDFEIKSRKLTLGNRKGQKAYFAQVKVQDKLTNEMLINRIVRGTSLSEGDVRNALITLRNEICEALEMGMSVDLAELGTIRVVVPSKMMDSEEAVTVKDALKTPRIVFSPRRVMRDAAKRVELNIDRGDESSSTPNS